MSENRYKRGTPRRAPPPLDQARLSELALSYVARFATTTKKLERYLQRKLRERGWDGEHEPDLDAITARHAELGYVDDRAYATEKAGALLRRGYGPRRVREALTEAGIDEDVRADLAPGEAARRRAVLALAKKRRFGPFGAEIVEPQQREKQVAAMLRAGHMLTDVRAVLGAQDEEAAQRWVDEADDDES